MTEDRMALIALAEQYADGDLLRELGQLVLQRLMDAEAEQRCDAGLHERSTARINQRNSYRELIIYRLRGKCDVGRNQPARNRAGVIEGRRQLEDPAATVMAGLVAARGQHAAS